MANMRKKIETVVFLAGLIGGVIAPQTSIAQCGIGPNCTTARSQQVCSGVTARMGSDRIDSFNGRPIRFSCGASVANSSGVFKPQVHEAGSPVGQSHIDVDWRIGSFSCLTYEVSYCTE